MTALAASLLLLGAPVPYWALGLPWVAGTARLRWAPLVGCAVAGLGAEWAMIAHLPVRASCATLVCLSGLIAALRLRRAPLANLGQVLVEWIPLYLLTALAVAVVPFPIVGSWSGDWYLNLRVGQAVTAGMLPAEMLKRPPLFGAATAPLWVVADGLVPFQIFAAVSSAATLLAIHHVMRWLRSGIGLMWLMPLLATPFFLHDTAALWAKLIAGAFVILAVMEAVRGARLASAIAFALAIASHEGFIIWLPFLLLCHARAGRGWRAAARALPSLAATGIVLAGPIVVWAVLAHGLRARVAANPVVTTHALMATDTMRPAVRIFLSVVTAFVGWAPLDELSLWFHRPQAWSAAVVGKEIYWVLGSWISTLAGTLFGFLLPFAAVAPALFREPRSPWRAVFKPGLLAGVAVAVFLNGAMSGIYCVWGMMQAALSPLALGAYVLLAVTLASHGERARSELRRVCWASLLIGALPWLLVNAGTTAGLWMSAGFRERFATSSESDYIVVLENHLSALGMVAFPFAPLVCLAGLFVFWIWFKQRADLAAQQG